jgi:hypothetical protein
MAESIISPGVFTRENDISFIQPAPIQAGAAFIGPTVKGPDNQPTIVTSYNDYVRRFGETFTSGSSNYEFLTSLAVKNYFSQGGGTALITRVVSGSYTAAQSTTVSSNIVGVAGAFATASITVASLNASITGSGEQITFVDANDNYYYIAAAAFGFNYNSYSSTTDSGYFSPNSGSGYTVGQWTASFANFINTQVTELGLTVVTGGANIEFSGSVAANGLRIYTDLFYGQPTGSSVPAATLGGGTPALQANTFTIATIGKGAIFNNSTAVSDPGALNSDGSLVSGSTDNLRWEIQNVNNAQGTFTLLVRQGNDSTNNPIILETFNNVSLDPNSPNYIEAVIGNQYTTVGTDGSTSYIYKQGTYPNRSNYIRVSSVTRTTPNYLVNDGITVNTDLSGLSYSASLPQVGSGSFYGATGAVKSGATYFAGINAASTNIQGTVSANYSTAISLLSNQDEYVFNIVSAPGMIHSNTIGQSVNNSIISLAESRGDCIAVVDLVPTGSILSDVTTQAATLNSSYAATYWPWVQVQSATGKNEYVPAGTVIPGVYAFTDASSAPWFAPAGLVRGGVAGVIQTERKLTKGDRDTLYLGKVNPIATFPGTGISVFGQKTLQTKASALDRVNVRRLLIELKKFIGDQARNLVFEQNTIATRNRFLATVNPYLESVVQRQGLYAYRVVMDDTNNTADVVDRNQLVGQIFIQPTKTIEFVVLDFTVEPTGATFA